MLKKPIMLNELPWLQEARKYIGLKEDISKDSHNLTLIRMLDEMGKFSGESKAWWREDETPWCGLFVGFCLGISGRFVVKEWYRAKSWGSDQMTKLKAPAYGSIAVFNREGGGHVGFVVGKNEKGDIMILGGNQSNSVSIVPFKASRIVGYFWPSLYTNKNVVKSLPIEERYMLPIFKQNDKHSINEA